MHRLNLHESAGPRVTFGPSECFSDKNIAWRADDESAESYKHWWVDEPEPGAYNMLRRVSDPKRFVNYVDEFRCPDDEAPLYTLAPMEWLDSLSEIVEIEMRDAPRQIFEVQWLVTSVLVWLPAEDAPGA
jgi:hypothetical protein